MDPGPKAVISEFIVKVTDHKSSILPFSTRFKVDFLRNGNTFMSLSPWIPLWIYNNGCLVMQLHLIVQAIGILVVDVFKVDADSTEVKLGAFYLDLEDVLQTHEGLISMHDAVMDLDDFLAMRLGLRASSFAPSLATQPILNFLTFDLCSEETTDADFMMYCQELANLVMCHNIFLIIIPEQLQRLHDRSLVIQCPDDRLRAFLIFATILDRQFRCTPMVESYSYSCSLFQDCAEAWSDLSMPMQLDVGRWLPYLPRDPGTNMSGLRMMMQSVGTFLIRRHYTMGNKNDLAQGICLLEAVEQLQAHPLSDDFILDQFQMYTSMNRAYFSRFELSKNVLDLDMALTALNKAIELPLPSWCTPVKTRSACLHKLSRQLIVRFSHLGAEHDLERAMECVDKALAGVLVDSPEHLQYLSLRELILSALSCRLGKKDTHFDQALKIQEALIVNAANLNHSNKLTQAKFELAQLLIMHLYSKSPIRQTLVDTNEDIMVLQKPEASDKADLRRAIDILVDCRPDMESDYAISTCEYMLACALMLRCLWCGNKVDLDEVISICSGMSTDVFYPGHHQLISLGIALYFRYKRFGRHPEDLYSARSVLSDAATSFNLDSRSRLTAAQHWIDIEYITIEEHCDPSRLLFLLYAFQTAMSIIPSVVWIGMAMQDRHNILMTWHGNQFGAAWKPRELSPWSIDLIPNRAATWAIICEELHMAIKWLEQGRSIIWDQLLQFRVPLDKLLQENPGLAQKLAALAKDLAKSSTMMHFWKRGDGQERMVSLEAEGQKHRRLATEWQQAVADVRKIPGFDKFLLPKDFDYLSKAANDAIVVIINVDQAACDALIIFPGSAKDVRHVSLPQLTFEDVLQMHIALLCLIRDDMGIRSDLTRRPVRKNALDLNITFRKILCDLWYKVVLPIICEAMEYQPSLVNCNEGQKRAHVRWCPTGHLAFLPLHAAGDYSSLEKGHRVFDFIISSYIPTLNSVIRSTSPSSSEETIKVLAVACPNATGQFPIPDTVEEVTRMGKHVVPLLDQPGTPVSRYIAIAKPGSATAGRVLEEMKKATWVHLACHGVQNATTPMSSALLLSNDSQLSLSDIAALDLPQVEFAFLSACQTATGSNRLPSESMHLAAGMMLAGYRSVIGTMWSIADRHAPDVADDVYGYLLRDGTSRRPDYKESALALHLAVEQLRKRIGEGSFLQWVPYIHIGE